MPGSHGIVGDVARKDDIHPIALQISGRARRARRAGQQRVEPRPGAARAARRHRCEDLEAALATNVARAVPADQGAARRAGRVGARRPAAPSSSTSSSDAAVTPYAGWGAYGASKAALRAPERGSGTRSSARTACASVARPGRHGHAAARAGRARRRPGDAEAAGTTRRARSSTLIDAARRRAQAAPRMKAADRAACSARATRSCSSSTPTGRICTRAAQRARRLPARRRPGGRERRRDPAGQPRRRAPARAARPIEVRLAGRRSLGSRRRARVHRRSSFGAGDYRTRTEDRAAPPPLAPATGCARAAARDRRARCSTIRGSSTCASTARADAIWAGIARHGRPIQYAHLARRSRCGTSGRRSPRRRSRSSRRRRASCSTGSCSRALRARGVGFATLTHAAGISSTGDADARRAAAVRRAVPTCPTATVRPSAHARPRGGRVVALGTTVDARARACGALPGGLRAGDGLADAADRRRRRGCASSTRSSAARTSRGTSHYELLRAFVDEATLARVDAALEARGYRTHEFGDSVWVERGSRGAAVAAIARARLVARRSASGARTRRRGAAEAQRRELRADDAGRHRQRAPADQHHQRRDEAAEAGLAA